MRRAKGGFKTLKLDDLRDMLPDLDELRPIRHHLMARSEPDTAKMWSGSSQVRTVGTRHVTAQDLASEVRHLAYDEARHLGALYGSVADALAALTSGDRVTAATCLLKAAELEERRERHDRAEAYSGAAYRAARDEKNLGPAALALRRWARAARSLGKLAHAQQRYENAYTMARALFDPRGAAEAAVGAGNVLEDQGQWDGAELWYRAGLAAIEEVGVPMPERLHSYMNLHIVTRTRGDLADSLTWLKRAEGEAAKVDSEGALPFVENAWGQFRMSTGDFEEAEAHFLKAIAAAQGARACVTIRLNLAEALLAQGRAQDATGQARRAEREAIQAGSVPKLPELYRFLGRIASMEGNSDAFVLFERALEIIRERDLPALEEAITLQAYAEAEARTGETDTAQQLLRDARERFRTLGINHLRRTWVDVYGPAPGSPAQLTNPAKLPK